MKPRSGPLDEKAEALGHEAKATGLATLWGATRLPIEPSHPDDGRFTLTHTFCSSSAALPRLVSSTTGVRLAGVRTVKPTL
jgi:hypothetical protein